MSQDKTEKKRKRSAENGVRPSKKAVLDTPSQVIKVSILQDTGDWAPVIASSPGLSLPSIPSLKPYKTARMNSSARPSSNGRTDISTSELLLHSSHHPKLDYTAREEESGGADSLLKHYVGVYDPKNGELQVVEARNLVLRGTLRPTAPSADINGSQEAEKEEATPNRLSARTNLGLAFGTKKSQKAIRALTENAITTDPTKSSLTPGKRPLDPVAGAVFESMAMSTGSMATREELQNAVDQGKPRPKPNLAAETAADVYKVQDLVGVDVLQTIRVQEWQDKINAGTDVKTSSRFVSGRLQKVVQSADVMKLKTLRYLLLLLDFYGALKPGARAVKKVPGLEDLKKVMVGVEERMVEGVKRRFADGSILNKWYVDNLITHICALALTIDNFDVDTYQLREDLKLENKEITQYFRELGCKVTAMTETEIKRLKLAKADGKARKVARLRLPLDFPRVRVPASRRR